MSDDLIKVALYKSIAPDFKTAVALSNLHYLIHLWLENEE
jgi:hypothetical protein